MKHEAEGVPVAFSKRCRTELSIIETGSDLIFNNILDQYLPPISDTTIQPQLRGGAAYAFASLVYALRATIANHVWGK
jgi:hypothetical protein